jgi:WD40 repeat protein
VTSVAFSPDGRFLASCDSQAGVVVRDLASGTTRKLIFGGARRVGWRPDGRALAVIGDRFSVFDAGTWEQPPDAGSSATTMGAMPITAVSTAVGRFGIVDVAWNRAGGELAVGETDLRVTDLWGGSGRVISPQKPSALAFSPDGKRLAVGARDGVIEIREGGLEKAIATLGHGKGMVTCLLWSRDGARLFAGDEHGAISGWSLATGQRFVDIPSQVLGVGNAAWGPHDRLATQHALWDMSRGTIVAKLEPAAWSVTWCGDVLVTLGRKEITWRQGTTGAVLGTAPAQIREGSVICSPDGRRVLAYGYGAEVWNTDNHAGSKLGDTWVASAAWGPGNRIALGYEHALEIWRLSNSEAVRELWRGDGARVLAWRPDGLIAADIGATRRIDADWIDTGLSALHAANLKTTGRWLASCTPDSLDHCDWSGAAWSPDGARLATIVDRVLSVLHTPPGPKPRSAPTKLPEHPGTYAVSWSPNGGVLAAADGFGVLLIRLRDGATVRLREIWVGDRILGLVDDGHGRFCGDSELTARVVKEAATRSGGPPRKPPSRDPDLLAHFLRAAAH